MTTIPLGIAGGIVGLALLNLAGTIMEWVGLGRLHQPFDMISMLGFLILMGTVVNNPILIVDRAIKQIQESGSSAIEAVREAVGSRLRPIAMSTLTTLPGLTAWESVTVKLTVPGVSSSMLPVPAESAKSTF